MIVEHSRIVLTTNVPDHDLVVGDVGTVVHVYPEAAAYEVEFVALDGATAAVATVAAAAVRAVRPGELTHARTPHAA